MNTQTTSTNDLWEETPDSKIANTETPTTPEYTFENIPQALKDIPHWVVWRYEHRKEKTTEKPTKVPYRADNPRVHASSKDPTTWSTFENARENYERGGVDGIGFVFTEETGFVGVDFDHCIEDGQINPDAWEELSEYTPTYAEVSPSGTGIHVLARGKIPRGRKRGDREMYSSGRYFTCTGWGIDGFSSEITDCQPAIDTHYWKWFFEKNAGVGEKPKPDTKPPELTDDEIIEIASRAENGAKFEALFRGNIAGYPSPSEADLALCGILSFYTQDAYQIDSIFRKSGLYREKWDEQHGDRTYGDTTIEKAMRNATGAYDPHGKTKHRYRELPPPPGEDERPRIKPILFVNGLSLEDKSERALRALIAANNPPRIFVKSGFLCRVVLDENDNPTAAILRKDDLKYELERVVQFAKRTKEKENDRFILLSPPDDVVSDILAYPNLSEKFPALDAITECPFILPDGGIISQTGYDENTRTFLIYRDELPPIPDRPTQADVQRAKEIIEDLFADFPFSDEASRENAIAGLFTTALRPAINGLTPLFCIDKPVMGAGGSLVSKLYGIVATGRIPSLSPFPDDDDEMRKVITTQLRGGASYLVFDNVQTDINQQALAAILTSEWWKDRLLGRNDEVKLRNRAMWVVNGNNLVLGGDIPRRTVYTRLVPDTEKPWEREETEFRHPFLEQYTLEHRREILAAILTIARYWVQQGRPKPDTKIPPMGSFEEWRQVIGGILTCAGYTDLMGNSTKMFQTNDENTEWDAFFEMWYRIWGEYPIRVSDIIERISLERNSAMGSYKDEEKLSDVLPARLADAINRGVGPERVFGKHIGKQRDRIRASNLRLVSAYKDSHTKIIKWKLVNITKKTESQETLVQ